MARDALPPYISKDTAESILFIGKAVRVLKQSASSRRPSGVCFSHHILALLHVGAPQRNLVLPGSCVPCKSVSTMSSLSDVFMLPQCSGWHPTGLKVLILCLGEMSVLLSMITESWTKELRQIQSAAIFHRLDLERVISSMQTQVCSQGVSTGGQKLIVKAAL